MKESVLVVVVVADGSNADDEQWMENGGVGVGIGEKRQGLIRIEKKHMLSEMNTTNNQRKNDLWHTVWRNGHFGLYLHINSISHNTHLSYDSISCYQMPNCSFQALYFQNFIFGCCYLDAWHFRLIHKTKTKTKKWVEKRRTHTHTNIHENAKRWSQKGGENCVKIRNEIIYHFHHSTSIEKVKPFGMSKRVKTSVKSQK